ncbi:MAG: glycosyltransferase family 4 protein [Clostridia bacterium]|nr:glycosyltransferase family 4 protein [Clostridia bacterium]
MNDKKKILHLCLGNAYVEGYSYQENMLTKFHAQLGYDVSIVASLSSYDENGKTCFLEKGSSFINEHGIPVTRLDYRDKSGLARKLRIRRYIGAYEAIAREKPDILFIHGCQFNDMNRVVKYLKEHPQVAAYVDNHADFSNTATNFISKYIVNRVIWRHSARLIEPYARKFYGVLPARVDFLINEYGIPAGKVELLVMGADDDEVARVAHPSVGKAVRERHGITSDDFLIVTGGKINRFKTQTLLLMKAVRSLGKDNVKLLVFGNVVAELKDEVMALCDGKTVIFAGWLDEAGSYDYFSAADLAAFPGRHSVYWEQAAGQGIPLMVKRWPGTTHVDAGGNVIFLDEDSEEEMSRKLRKLIDDPEAYAGMKKAAVEKGMRQFSYRDIALRSVEGKE